MTFVVAEVAFSPANSHFTDYSEFINNFYSFINGSIALCWALAFSSVRDLSYTVGRTPWTSDQPVAMPLPTQRTPQAQNKRT
jgi:hypothetical protein